MDTVSLKPKAARSTTYFTKCVDPHTPMFQPRGTLPGEKALPAEAMRQGRSSAAIPLVRMQMVTFGLNDEKY